MGIIGFGLLRSRGFGAQMGLLREKWAAQGSFLACWSGFIFGCKKQVDVSESTCFLAFGCGKWAF